jgi:hypothetical protein
MLARKPFISTTYSNSQWKALRIWHEPILRESFEQFCDPSVKAQACVGVLGCVVAHPVFDKKLYILPGSYG